ncbi:hypothetical protein [Nonomuraea sp. NPDC049709]|uniref:alcohol dehydrogenase catalytic domain-containing protein n=1 Tax=Nonomuraea sp. NPDC049709 TaxID=3154736 RepID=UPI003428CD04
MKAIVYRDNGAPDVLRLVDRDPPAPGPGEVRVRVAVSGANPTDWQARSAAAHPKRFPEVTPHLDGAGTIFGLPRRPSAVPRRAASASTDGFRHRTSGVGIGAMATDVAGFIDADSSTRTPAASPATNSER